MTGKKQTQHSGTIARVVRILQCLAEFDADFSLKDMAERLELPPSTVHRLLQLLFKEGIVERSPAGHLYRPGLELIRIGSLVSSKTRITEVARPFMRAVVERCGEVCMLVLHMPTARKVMVIDSVDSSMALRYQVDKFTPTSLLWGATGRSVLAFLPLEDIERAIADGDPSPASGQRLPARKQLLDDLAAIRRKGYARTNSQKIEGAVGMGAPVFGAERRVIGSLCITIPQMRFKAAAEPQLSNLLITQARALSAALGFSQV